MRRILLPPRWSSGLRRIAVAAAVLTAFLLGLWIGLPDSEPTEEGTAQGTASKAELWTCSMHPQIQLPEPGDCPICGMDLIPLASDGDEAREPGQIAISDRARILARVRTVPAAREAGPGVELKLLGKFEANETRVRTVTPWVGGRIDELYVSTEGAKITRGQPIARVYSPEIYTAQQDLVTARRQLKDLEGALPVARGAAQSTLQAARQRLALLGVPEGTIDEMAREESPRQHVTIYAQHSGTVLEQLVNQGAYMSPGTPLFRVADLGQLWLQMDAYESDLALISVGQEVTIQVATFPGELFEGKVAFIDPIVDPQTRTAQVRVEVPNPKGRLSPGMFAEAMVHAAHGAKREPPIVVPRSAVLFTGKRSLVYVAVPNSPKPTYEAREVQLGPRTGDVYPVVGGLEEGEHVVVAGAFALDSELQIRGGDSMMARSDDPAREAMEPLDVSESFKTGFAVVVDAYLDLQKHLASDDLAASKNAAKKLATAAEGFSTKERAEVREAWESLKKPLIHHATQAQQADSLKRIRQVFELLGRLLIRSMERFGNPLSAHVKLAFCPMAGTGGEGAQWLQRANTVENPYYGAQMFTCGEIRQDLASGQHLRLDEKRTKAPAPEGHQH